MALAVQWMEEKKWWWGSELTVSIFYASMNFVSHRTICDFIGPISRFTVRIEDEW